ncbi:MAG: biotin/lipoyl-binding protein, partial [Saprospiraceae bacterium]
MRLLLLFFMIIILGNACTSSEASDIGSKSARLSLQASSKVAYEVGIKTAQKGNFPLKVITTGTLSAAQQLQVTLPSSGEVAEYSLKVGQIIKKGELLTQLDDIDLQYQLRQAALDLEKAIFEKNDMLVLQGGKEDQD